MSITAYPLRVRKPISFFLMCLSFGGFFLSCVSKQKYQALKADYQEVKDENSALSEKKQRLSSRKKSLQVTKTDLKERIERYEVGIRIVKDSIDSIQGLAYDMEALRLKYQRTKKKLPRIRKINELLLGNIIALRKDMSSIGSIALDTCLNEEASDKDTCYMAPVKEWEYRLEE